MAWSEKVVTISSDQLGDYIVGFPLSEKSKFSNDRAKNWARSVDNELHDRGIIGRTVEVVSNNSNNPVNPVTKPKLKVIYENLDEYLSPKFHPDTKVYRLTALPHEETVQLNPRPEDADATVLVNNVKLAAGGDIRVRIDEKQRQVIQIKVIRPGHGSNTYSIIVTRNSKNNNAQLKRLNEDVRYNDFSPGFHKHTTEYDITIDFMHETFGLRPEPEDKYASVTIQGQPVENNRWHEISVPYGLTKVEVAVQAESGYVKKYTVNVHRQRWPNASDTELRELSTNLRSSINPAFDPNVRTYYIRAARDEDEVNVIARPKSGNAFVTINGHATEGRTIRLSPGRNEINITVELLDEFVKEYKILVDRLYDQ